MFTQLTGLVQNYVSISLTLTTVIIELLQFCF